MSRTLIDFTCKNLEGESFGHMFSRTSDFCCWLSHKSYKDNNIPLGYWNIMNMNIENPNYFRDQNGNIKCIKPCKYCIMDFVLKRLVHIIITRYRRVKKYKQRLLNIKGLHEREITGK